MFSFYKKYFLPASIIAGTIIGAGIFSLPFIFLRAGPAVGFIYLTVITAVFICLYILYADLVVRTPGEHRFVGYAKIYFGKAGFLTALVVNLLQLFFVLAIYLILAPSFLKLFFPVNGLNHVLLFWLAGSIVILFNTRRIAVAEFLITVGIVGIIFLTGFLGLPKFFSNQPDWGVAQFFDFSIIGPIFFALSGALSIPEVISYFREANLPLASARKAIKIGAILPALVYIVFIIGVIGLSKTVSEDAVSGLIGNIPDSVLMLIGVLGFLSLISSYIVIGLSARRNLQYDLGFSGIASRVMVVAAPLALYLAGFQDFIGAVTFVGAIFMPLESLLLILIWRRADKISKTPPLIVTASARKSIPILVIIFTITLLYYILR